MDPVPGVAITLTGYAIVDLDVANVLLFSF